MIPSPNPYPPQTALEAQICVSSFWWKGNAAGLAKRWGISTQKLVTILRGPYGPASP